MDLGGGGGRADERRGSRRGVDLEKSERNRARRGGEDSAVVGSGGGEGKTEGRLRRTIVFSPPQPSFL